MSCPLKEAPAFFWQWMGASTGRTGSSTQKSLGTESSEGDRGTHAGAAIQAAAGAGWAILGTHSGNSLNL